MLTFLCLIFLMGLSPDAQASTDLTTLSIEELMETEVSLPSKKARKLSGAASAVYVITQEDIRRSGAVNIPELLSMVPGIEVVQINANKWAISSRGFNEEFADKLLVLMDGQSVYTPLFSGVQWDMHDTMLEDIERIEVIRGPGATLWGANAVNGIINIITKSARDTRGGLLTLGTGTEEKGFGGLRYGEKLKDCAYWRIWARYFDRDSYVYDSGDEAFDDWDVLQGGFRADWDSSDADSVTFQGNLYDGSIGNMSNLTSISFPYSRSVVKTTDIAGGSLLARWEHTFSDDSDMKAKVWYDRAERDDIVFGYVDETFDIDFQHRFKMSRQEIIWGGGYRLASNDTRGSFTVSADPKSSNEHICSAFIQDEISLVKERLSLILGSKFEHNSYTGFEIQPNARIAWTPGKNHTAWAAVSRAVRTPGRNEKSMRINAQTIPGKNSLPTLIAIIGNSDQDSEDLLACELGYRTMLGDRVSLDIAAYYNIYDNITTQEPADPFYEETPGPAHMVVPTKFGNKGEADVYGAEIAANFKLMKGWRVFAGYSWKKSRFSTDSSGRHTEVNNINTSPEHQLKFRSYLDLPFNLEFDMTLCYADSFPRNNVNSYTRIDLRLGWQPYDAADVSLCLKNMLDSQHSEYDGAYSLVPTEAERSVYAKIAWRF